MSILNPDQLNQSKIHEVLSASGIGRRAPSDPARKEQLPQLLEDANLSPEEILENLSAIIRSGENDSVRLRGIETVAKMHGMLQDNKNVNFAPITIIINDGGVMDVNPILIPR